MEIFRGNKFGTETSTRDAWVMHTIDERLGTSGIGKLCDIALR